VSWLETRKLPALFAVATLLPIAVLCWLGVRTLQQDRALERQRRNDRLEVDAGRIALEIEEDLQRIETRLAAGEGIRFSSAEIDPPADEPLLFRPDVPSVATVFSGDLAAVAALEHRDTKAAIAAYERIVRTASAAERGEALVALGGLFRRQHRFDDALRVYEQLAQLGRVAVAGGQPAALVAKQGRAKVFVESGDHVRLRDAAVSFARALHGGGWLIDRASFELYQHDMIEPWGGPAADPEAIRRAAAVSEFWRLRRRGELTDRGRRVIGAGTDATLAVWLAEADGPIAAFLTSGQLRARWRPLWEHRGLTVAVSRVDGEPVFGGPVVGGVRPSDDTRLPFTIVVAANSAALGDDTTGWQVVIAGIALACALMIAASYGLYRITTRELLLARQQSDFVAAVSHEFRTPLTSMRHLLDLLIARGVHDDSRKSHYYSLLAGETDRLQRMVETLLSFGRVDAGAHVWKLEPLEVADLIADVCAAFRNELGARSLVTEVDNQLPSIRGDREALSRALWNLLENAGKYSPGDSPIRVFARRSGTTVVLGVEDHGIGIAVAEQQRVFQKFVRGDEAKRAGIRGVGVGLALVKRIAEAHGGSVRVESEVGRGSTFTLVLPYGRADLKVAPCNGLEAAG
jgi:signal transduction histidine kinase